MGAAAVCMASGETLPSQVKAVVSDCAFTDLSSMLAGQVKKLYGLPRHPVVDDARIMLKARGGYDIKRASALDQVKKSSTPTLFIHGLSAVSYTQLDVYKRQGQTCDIVWLEVLEMLQAVLAVFERPVALPRLIEDVERAVDGLVADLLDAHVMARFGRCEYEPAHRGRFDGGPVSYTHLHHGRRFPRSRARACPGRC